MPRTLHWKLLLTILPLVTLAIATLFWLQYRLAKAEILTAINRDLRSLAERTAANIDELLGQRRRDLFTLSESSLIGDYYRNVDFQLFNEAETYRQELEKYLLNFSKRGAVYTELLYLDAQGRPVCAVDHHKIVEKKPGSPPSYFPLLKKIAPGSWWVSPPEKGPGGASALYYAKPIYDESGRFKGALVLGYGLAQIHDILGLIKVGETGKASILSARESIPLKSGDILAAESLLTEMPWKILVEAPLRDFLGPLKKIRDLGAFTALLCVVGLIALTLLLVRLITRPIVALVEAAHQIGKGRLDHRIEKITEDELGTLSAAFNEMAENLDSNRKLNTRLQSQLIQAEKLSAVGQLVASVAHELNNPLASVCGYAQMSLLEAPPGLREDLEHVHHNALRCRKVVDNLLFFVRQSSREKGKINLNQAVASALELLDYRLTKTEDVAVVRDLGPEVKDCIGDFQQIVQVIVNLINNACDAMEETARYPDGKKITLRTRMEAGRASLHIEDNGPGIPAGVQGQVFEPFFTTKEPGRGTGLGLSICRQIIEEHGGFISFTSREGEGAAFAVALLPASEAELMALEPPSPAAANPPAVPGKKILVADDEKDIAELVARLLVEDGDHVSVATQGLEALRLVRENSYDLVICDYEMEKSKGTDIFMELASKKASPAPKILFITGDILNPKVLNFLHKTKSEYLAKPFDLDALRRKARRLLAGGR